MGNCLPPIPQQATLQATLQSSQQASQQVEKQVEKQASQQVTLQITQQQIVKKITDFSLEGKICKIIVPIDGIYDGDTFRAQFSIYPNSPIEQFKIRMYGYDSPEMKPLKSKKNREEEIKLAHIAKNALASKIIDKDIIVLFGPFDKYGRPLGILFAGHTGLSRRPLDAGLGRRPLNAGLGRRPLDAGLGRRPLDAGLDRRPLDAGLDAGLGRRLLDVELDAGLDRRPLDTGLGRRPLDAGLDTGLGRRPLEIINTELSNTELSDAELSDILYGKEATSQDWQEMFSDKKNEKITQLYNKSINYWMIENNYGYPYFGGTKI